MIEQSIYWFHSAVSFNEKAFLRRRFPARARAKLFTNVSDSLPYTFSAFGKVCVRKRLHKLSTHKTLDEVSYLHQRAMMLSLRQFLAISGTNFGQNQNF
jgi:hypothetical protein